jgi:hypothetical protein
MGSMRTPEFIRAVRDCTLLTMEFSQWGLDKYKFDIDGNFISGPRDDVPGPGDANIFL